MNGYQQTPWLHEPGFGNFLGAWASSMGAPAQGASGQQPPPVQLPDYGAGIDKALAANAQKGDQQKQNALKAGIGNIAQGLVQWQQEQEAAQQRASRHAAESFAAGQSAFAQAQQAAAARLQMQRRTPAPMMGFGLPARPYSGGF